MYISVFSCLFRCIDSNDWYVLFLANKADSQSPAIEVSLSVLLCPHARKPGAYGITESAPSVKTHLNVSLFDTVEASGLDFFLAY